MEHYGNQSQGDQDHVEHIRLAQNTETETMQLAQNTIYLVPDGGPFRKQPLLARPHARLPVCGFIAE